MIRVFLRAGVLILIVVGTLKFLLGVAARKNPIRPPSSLRSFLRSLAAVVGSGALIIIVDGALFIPLFGGYRDFVIGDLVASSTMKGLTGRLSGADAALAVYYGETEGRYPASLDELWLNERYLLRSPGHADVFTFDGSSYHRAHWYYKTDDVRNFSSREQADDSGGWGYVSDPKSPEWGTVFVNCTHAHWSKGVPWNLSSDVTFRSSAGDTGGGRPAAAHVLAAAARRLETPKPDLQRIRIPGGSFKMGSDDLGPDERPAHRVDIKSFYLAKTEVTNKQYRACVEAGKCTAPSAYLGSDEHPVVNVDWEQARRFSEWVEGRLPTESEWEYAARGAGRNYKFPWGDEEASCERAVMNGQGPGCGRNSSWPVCSKTAGNSLQGLCDMAGNVSEWTQDWHHASYVGAPNDGSAWETPSGTQRVTRGGSWYSDLREGSLNRWVGQGGPGQGFRPAWGP